VNVGPSELRHSGRLRASGDRRRRIEVERIANRAGRSIEGRGIPRPKHQLASVAAVQEYGVRPDADVGMRALDRGQGLGEVAFLAAHPQRLFEERRRDELLRGHLEDVLEQDLVVAVARDRHVPRPDWVVLYDPDERVVGEAKASTATETQVRQWMHAALVHLSSCAKYLTRGSLWEANAQLDAARSELWRLWAVAERIADPQYGLTAVLDAPDAPMPDNIEATVAGLDRRELRSAAMACGELLVWTWPRAISTVATADLAMPPLAEWVLRQLRDVAT